MKLGAHIVMRMNIIYNTLDWLAKANKSEEKVKDEVE